ncbi:hypothetical protein CWE09_06665 [Aliidiomarina minuta]|uniref:Flagellar hook-associated protein 2 n=1 Tax=Aliidiomarina minuta TaxID=880057 RepID=A0A432W8I1_9GAMM|nr:flagellar filament capping protein FliD [Aliidiomarina minuta]RUO26385.1 hypothetical protein CWE09_06665 [Aliidiomarina minuta]
MAMTSLGVGSGLELDQMVRQLVQLERQPRIERLDERTKTADTNISALGSLKSAMTKVQDALNDLNTPRDLSARTAAVTGQPEDNPFFTATANSNAARSNYNIDVLSVAAGSRLQSGAFDNSTDPVATGNGTLTFAAGGDNTFDVDIEDGASLSEIARAVNRAGENFGVSASVVNTGTESFLVFDSEITGEGNDLTVEANGVGGLDNMTTANLTTQRAAASAQIEVDGIAITSETNTFENAIEGVSLTVNRITGAEDAPNLAVDIDREGVRENIDAFMKAYNEMIDQVDKLTAYAPEGKSGPLIGDSMVRSIRSQMSSLISSPVDGAADGMSNLFQMGIVTDNDGKLEFDSRNIGGGTGEQRFEQALNQNFDDVVALFAGDNGIATRMTETVKQYTQTQGLIDGRQNVFENQKKMVDNEREQFERYMENFESNMRSRFGALDQNIARMQNSSSFLMQRLGQM